MNGIEICQNLERNGIEEIEISSCYHNLAALMLIFTFLGTLLKYMVADVLRSSSIRLTACNSEYLIPLVIIVSMCEVFSPERRCTRHALQKHCTNRQIFKKF